MNRPRTLLVNFERMWREMDELAGDPFTESGGRLQGRAQTGFSPRVDVYLIGATAPEEVPAGSAEFHRISGPRVIVKVDLAGVQIEKVALEVSGRELVITGERPVAEKEGRVYQQVEIEAGPFRRIVELAADVVAEEAKASYEDGILRVELPLAGQVTRRVPIE